MLFLVCLILDAVWIYLALFVLAIPILLYLCWLLCTFQHGAPPDNWSQRVVPRPLHEVIGV
jgi:hypothetical protein